MLPSFSIEICNLLDPPFGPRSVATEATKRDTLTPNITLTALQKKLKALKRCDRSYSMLVPFSGLDIRRP